MSKLKMNAFTIMEVTISMLVTAIVIGIAFMAFSIISQSYNTFNTKNDKLASLSLLDKLLQKDFSRADSVVLYHGELACFTHNDTTRYKIDSNLIVRQSLIIDSFKGKFTAIKATFENKVADTAFSGEKPQIIDKLSLTLKLGTDNTQFIYHKMYSSEDLLGKDTNAINRR